MRRGPFLILFAVSGAAALIYEVVWTRLLTLHMGHGLAAASAVLAAFMGGLAAGAGAAGRYAGTLPPRRALTLYAGLEIAIGALAVLMPFMLIAVRPLLAATYADGNGGATFAFVRLATSVFLAVRAGRVHGRDVSDRVAMDRPHAQHRGAGCRRVCMPPTRSAPRPARCSPASC